MNSKTDMKHNLWMLSEGCRISWNIWPGGGLHFVPAETFLQFDY